MPDGSIATLSGAVSDDGHIAEFTANGIDIYADDGELTGTYSVGIGEEATPHSVEWQSDGKLLLLYSENDDLLLQRYNTDGSIDYSLHGTGALKLYDAVVSGATGLNSLPDGSVQATATTADGDLIHFNLTPKQIHAPFDVSGQAATIEWSATGDYHVVWLSNIDTKQRVGYWVTDQTSLTTHYLPQGRYRVWVQPVRPLSESPSDDPSDYTSTGPWSEGHEFRAVRAGVRTRFLRDIRLQRTAAPSAPEFSWFPLEVYSREEIVYDLQVVAEGSDTPVLRQESIEGRGFWSRTSLLSGRYDVWLLPKVKTAAGETPIGGWERTTLEIEPPPEPLIDDFSSVSPIANPAPELTWSASPGEPLYELKVNEVDSGASVLHRHRLATSSYVPETPFPPGSYEMQVRDHTSTGVSEWRRQEFSIIAPSSGHVALVGNPLQSPDVTLAWTDNPAVQSWIVTLDEDNDGLDRGEGGVTANDYQFSDVAAGTYTASVWSVYGEGDHRLLGSVDVIIPESATRSHIHGIIDESAVASGGRTLNPRPMLSWSRTTDATSYSVWLQDISRIGLQNAAPSAEVR